MIVPLPPATGLTRRVMRGSFVTFLGYGGTQGVRLVGNLILARLLFPEAFGVMQLVTVLMVGLAMISDLGIGPAIQGSKRGDDPEYLDTAWVLKLGRSCGLFLAACALAWPMATFYQEPLLLQLIPVTAISLLILGFEPTKIDTAERHLQLGRVTLLELGAQCAALVVMVLVALITGSIWAMVAGAIAAAMARVALAWWILPGHNNRFRFDRSAARDLINFGRWIFLSTVAGFLVQQADKLVLGRFLSMEDLGLYNIGYFLAGFPLMLGTTLVVRLMIPVYRDSPPQASAANFRRLRRIRGGLTGALMTMMAVLVVIGPSLVGLLYDARYALSGGVLVVMALALMPQLVTLAYDRAALAAGDSQGFFLVNAGRALAMVGLLVGFVPGWGVGGAALAGFGAAVLTYPLQIWLARRHGAWDAAHDLLAYTAILLLGLLAWMLHGPLIREILATMIG